MLGWMSEAAAVIINERNSLLARAFPAYQACTKNENPLGLAKHAHDECITSVLHTLFSVKGRFHL